jgi:hypothetical protein
MLTPNQREAWDAHRLACSIYYAERRDAYERFIETGECGPSLRSDVRFVLFGPPPATIRPEDFPNAWAEACKR